MRTWDRIRAGEWHRHGTAVEFHEPPQIIIGDDVARMILDGHRPEFPICAPPWKNFAIEMNPNPWPFQLGDDMATSVLLSFTDMTDIKVPPLAYGEPSFAHRAREIIAKVKDRGGWVLGLEIFGDFPAGVLPLYWTSFIIEADGTAHSMQAAHSFLTGRQIESPAEDPHPDHDTDELLEAYRLATRATSIPFAPGSETKADPEWWTVEALSAAGLMTISLINCSNIGLAEETPDYTRKERRRLERKDKPVVAFKRLHIHPHKSHARGAGSADSETGVAIHIVRGHFKTYTEDAPLLGKFVGTWWWQPQVRGTDAGHFVVKDYEVDSE